MKRPHRSPPPLTRRDALCRIGNGFGMLAFASLVGESLARAAGPVTAGQDAALAVPKLDHPARAKHVIFLFMNGGLSQVDSFDPKPMLDKYHGQPLPGGTVATERKTGALMRSPFAFKKYGQCGMEVSELFPNVGECADDDAAPLAHFPLARQIHLVHHGQLDQVRAAQPGIDLGRGRGQLAAGVVGDQQQQVLCQEHDVHATRLAGGGKRGDRPRPAGRTSRSGLPGLPG